jgi:hypothetical protein
MSDFNFNGFFLKKHFFYFTDKRLFPTQWSFHVDNSDGDSSIVADNQDCQKPLTTTGDITDPGYIMCE